MNEPIEILAGDCRRTLWSVESGSIQTCVTSPPRWFSPSHLPDGHPDRAREIGQEASPYVYVIQLVSIFRYVWDALRDDGTLWLHLSDVYSLGGLQGVRGLFGLPGRVATAMQANRWILQADIALERSSNPPSALTPWGRIEEPEWDLQDHLFLFSKSQQYHCSGSHLPKRLSMEEGCVQAGAQYGQAVLDCFGGNGKTARAAVSGGRPVIACELSAERAHALRDEFGIRDEEE